LPFPLVSHRLAAQRSIQANPSSAGQILRLHIVSANVRHERNLQVRRARYGAISLQRTKLLNEHPLRDAGNGPLTLAKELGLPIEQKDGRQFPSPFDEMKDRLGT
jgi:hypothetical protein